MDAILELVVEYRTLCIWISVFLILALIGALADRSASKRFAIDTEKMRTNVNNDTVDEANKTAGEAPELTNTNITSGTSFGDAPAVSKIVPNETKNDTPAEAEPAKEETPAEVASAPESAQPETL